MRLLVKVFRVGHKKITNPHLMPPNFVHFDLINFLSFNKKLIELITENMEVHYYNCYFHNSTHIAVGHHTKNFLHYMSLLLCMLWNNGQMVFLHLDMMRLVVHCIVVDTLLYMLMLQNSIHNHMLLILLSHNIVSIL